MRIVAILMLLTCGAPVLAADKGKTLPEEIRPDLAGETTEDVLDNIRTVRTYDSKGLVVSKVIHSAVGRQSKWLYSYDMHGRLVTLTNPDQSRMLYEYPDEKTSKHSRIKLFGPDGQEREFQ